jgi:dipeptidase D
MPVKDLQPTALWKNFADLNAVPRPSKQEERVIQFMMDFGNRLGLPTIQDKIGNVIIKKAATAGMEDRQTIVMQSHLDMVHQKNADTDFDFQTEGIRMRVQDDWVDADGTTLGADNGIGVATIMALLESTDIAHPAIEALFTIDEETGMTGALQLEEGLLDGTILLNLDTEDDDELTIGCAGGVDITATATYAEVDAPQDTSFVVISITGLSGGHSGMDIHKGLGNANKLMNRLLVQLEARHNIHVSKVEGGSLRNAIPRESFALVGIAAAHISDLLATVAEHEVIIKREYATTDPSLDINVKRVDSPAKVWNGDWQRNILRSIYACPSGIYRMSPDIDGLVQTSNNLARVHIEGGKAEVLCLCRSSVDTEKADMALAIGSAFELAGCEVDMSGSYPGWTPAPSSDIVQVMRDLYREMFDGEPHVNACHAGLECGIIGDHYPHLDMISFGPNIRGAHSPDERVQISSVQKYWSYLLETLKRIPKRA